MNLNNVASLFIRSGQSCATLRAKCAHNTVDLIIVEFEKVT